MPFDYHRFIIGQKGKGVREMMKNFDVNISIPPAEEHSNVIRITGTPDKVCLRLKGDMGSEWMDE